VLTHSQAGSGRRDRLELTACFDGRLGLGVKALEVTHAAPTEQDNTRFRPAGPRSWLLGRGRQRLQLQRLGQRNPPHAAASLQEPTPGKACFVAPRPGRTSLRAAISHSSLSPPDESLKHRIGDPMNVA